jgi:hypothetical protein
VSGPGDPGRGRRAQATIAALRQALTEAQWENAWLRDQLAAQRALRQEEADAAVAAWLARLGADLDAADAPGQEEADAAVFAGLAKLGAALDAPAAADAAAPGSARRAHAARRGRR